MGMHVIIIVMKIHDLKNKDYTAYIFDMDGTLYYQRPLRMRMFLCMAGFYLTHPLRWKEPFMVRDYRKLRENEALLKKENWKDLIRNTLSDKYHVEKSRLQETINFWMQEKPLEYIKNYQDKTLKHFIEQLQASGKKIIIYSDYPAGKKAASLGINGVQIYDPEESPIRFLKPDPQGLLLILKENRLEKERSLMIGDRYEKDGICAENAGIDHLILKRTRSARKKQYLAMGVKP